MLLTCTFEDSGAMLYDSPFDPPTVKPRKKAARRARVHVDIEPRFAGGNGERRQTLRKERDWDGNLRRRPDNCWKRHRRRKFRG